MSEKADTLSRGYDAQSAAEVFISRVSENPDPILLTNGIGRWVDFLCAK